MLRTVEEHLDEQAEMLSSIRSLIEDKIPFAGWAASEQAAFTAALQPPEEMSQFEEMKARNLARHLFRQDIENRLPLSEEFDRFDLADRIRADLAGLVRLGAGRHLRDEILGVTSGHTTRP
ncbi:hypothetical protein D3C71_259050 [compost metagenome]